ncbi:MAG: glutamine amidotransferase [Pseudomonadota bacterium]
MKPVAIIKTGETLPDIAAARGDFENWISEGLGADISVNTIEVFKGETLPNPATLSGIVITGSPAMVTDREDWSERTADWLHEVASAKIPTLGICYGHQLIAHAFGGEVGSNPNGREIGTADIQLESSAAQDPLFASIDAPLAMQTSHLESVLALPPAAKLLATTSLDPHHAFSLDDFMWGIQFHPEFDKDIVQRYIRLRQPAIESEGLDADAIFDAAQESSHSDTLWSSFMQIIQARNA